MNNGQATQLLPQLKNKLKDADRAIPSGQSRPTPRSRTLARP
jgi:hypothetical protein